MEAEPGRPGWEGLHKPCLAREAETWSASVDSWGESAMLMLPEDDTVLSWWGESSKETISAPWSVRALAVSRKVSLWLSIWDTDHRGEVRGGAAPPWWLGGGEATLAQTSSFFQSMIIIGTRTYVWVCRVLTGVLDLYEGVRQDGGDGS